MLALVDAKLGHSQIGEEGGWGPSLFYNDFTKHPTKLQKCVLCRITPVPYQQADTGNVTGCSFSRKENRAYLYLHHGTCGIVSPNDASASCHPSISPVVQKQPTLNA